MRGGRSGRQRRIALMALLAAAAVAAIAFPFRRAWWGGWILAIAEAGVVGGLADWFAVTALFRRPLGLPIPHTALIPANWQLMAARVGTMVGDRVLTKTYITQEIARLDLADLLARGAERLTRAHLEDATRRVGRWLAGQMPASTPGDLGGRLRSFLTGQPLAPGLATALEAARKHSWDERVIATLARALGEAMERPAFREAVRHLVDDVLMLYRQRGNAYPSFWLGVARMLGLIDRERIVTAIMGGLQAIARDPEHPLRRQLMETMAGWPERLRTDARLATRVETFKEEALESEVVRDLLERGFDRVWHALLDDLNDDESATVAWISEHLEGARRTLLDDADLRRRLDAWVKERAVGLIEQHHGQIALFIEKGVHALGAEGAVRLIEEHAGDDLQYIRLNGTVVGGLAGGALYAVHLLIDALF
jgi:uncharacterized membrane-anchored protein YjiN (DUF445 family)